MERPLRPSQPLPRACRTTSYATAPSPPSGRGYCIERELGGGGMSRVFVAEDVRLRRRIVAKVLSPELTAGISAERFGREVQLAAALQQANIVPLITVGDTAGLPYYTMPFVEGLSLRARLARNGALPVAETIDGRTLYYGAKQVEASIWMVKRPPRETAPR